MVNLEIDAFNLIFNAGDYVFYRPIRDNPKSILYLLRMRAFRAMDGTPVVFLQGKRGYVALENIFVTRSQIIEAMRKGEIL